MKHKFLLSAVTALVVFAATATAEAGIFGRLSVVWNGCNPCEPVACMPCEPIPVCEPVVCNPCDVIACDPCGHGFAPRPFRPFGGFFANKFAVAHCAPIACEPCEPIVCNPCDVVVSNPCDVVYDPCATDCGPRLPFNGFFLNLKSRLSLKSPCCGAAACEPVCDPCAVCW